ncbi:unnamed protein product [Rhizoctonia solani]|uniref:Uncharacterized protein n=1 Tax=Rhizoctonia solani TaxID=456999 RepID=A0A8H3BDH5_9AGAM|nr:unnamed protein product [Rhizoctonia solani]
MAPPGSFVHHAEGVVTDHPHHCASFPELRLTVPLTCLTYKGEYMPPCNDSLAEVGSRIRCLSASATKHQHEIQIRFNPSYDILQENVNLPIGNISKRIGVRGLELPKLMDKLEPDTGGASSLFKSLSVTNRPPTPQEPKHKFEYDHEFIVKIEPEPAPASFHHQSTRAEAMDSVLCGVGKPQDEPISPYPTANSSRSCGDAHDSKWSEEGRITTEVPRADSRQSYNSEQSIAMHASIINAFQSFLANKQDALHPLKSTLYSRLNSLCTPHPDINPSSDRAASYPPLNPQPPKNSHYELLSHQDTPESLPMVKSLFGLARYLKSQVGVSASSPNPIAASNAPLPNQTQYSSNNSASGSGTTGETSNPVNNSEQHAKSETNETTNDPELDNLDAHSLYQLSYFCYTLALQRDPSIGNIGTSQNHVPDLFAPTSDDPVPLLIQLDESGSRGIFPGANYPSTSAINTQHHPGGVGSSAKSSDHVSDNRLQTAHIKDRFGGDLSFIDPDNHAQFLPHHVILGQPAAALPTYNSVTYNVAPLIGSNKDINHVHAFRITGSVAMCAVGILVD